MEQHPTGPDPARAAGGTAPSERAASSSPLLCTHTLLLRFQRAIHELVKAWRINNNELISMPSAERLPWRRLAPEQEFFPRSFCLARWTWLGRSGGGTPPGGSAWFLGAPLPCCLKPVWVLCLGERRFWGNKPEKSVGIGKGTRLPLRRHISLLSGTEGFGAFLHRWADPCSCLLKATFSSLGLISVPVRLAISKTGAFIEAERAVRRSERSGPGRAAWVSSTALHSGGVQPAAGAASTACRRSRVCKEQVNPCALGFIEAVNCINLAEPKRALGDGAGCGAACSILLVLHKVTGPSGLCAYIEVRYCYYLQTFIFTSVVT